MTWLTGVDRLRSLPPYSCPALFDRKVYHFFPSLSWHKSSMTCAAAAPNYHNQFAPLASLKGASQYELSQALQQRNSVRRTAPQQPTPLDADQRCDPQQQYNSPLCQNGAKPGCADVRTSSGSSLQSRNAHIGQARSQNDIFYQDKGPRYYPATSRPRYWQGREICRNWLNGYSCFSDPCPFFHQRPTQVSEFRNELNGILNNPASLPIHERNQHSRSRLHSAESSKDLLKCTTKEPTRCLKSKTPRAGMLSRQRDLNRNPSRIALGDRIR
jgi:hypothetical protein